MLGWYLDKWRYSGASSETCGFLQTQNDFGLKFRQMAIFRVLRQKHVVIYKVKIMLGWYLDKWRYFECFVGNMWFFQTQNDFGLKLRQMAIFRVLRQKHVVFYKLKMILGWKSKYITKKVKKWWYFSWFWRSSLQKNGFERPLSAADDFLVYYKKFFSRSIDTTFTKKNTLKTPCEVTFSWKFWQNNRRFWEKKMIQNG